MRELSDGERDLLNEALRDSWEAVSADCPLCYPDATGQLCPVHDAEAVECDGCGKLYVPDSECDSVPPAWSSADGLTRGYCQVCSGKRRESE